MKRKAFTLAEVLVTLGIIGVVASMTLPTLIQKQNEKAMIVSLKKFYSDISQAYSLVINNEGTPDTWGMSTNAKISSKLIFEKFEPYLKKVKKCDYGQENTCFNENITYKFMRGSSYSAINPFSNFQTFILADGSIAFFEYINKDCKGSYGSVNDVCFSVYVDINGDKNPNRLGEDYHGFKLTSKGVVIPHGSVKFNDSTSLSFKDTCGKDKSGYGCTAWMLYNENMDYLRCVDELDWNGKSSCK